MTQAAALSDVRTQEAWVAGTGVRKLAAPSEVSPHPRADGTWALDVRGGPHKGSRAETHFVSIVFDGVLYNAAELARTFGLPANATSEAALLLSAYERWGLDLTGHTKGIYALVISDRLQKRLIAIRDPLGSSPLFFAKAGDGRVLVSTSIAALVRQPSVDGTVNRAALADHLCHRWPYPTETFYSAIQRVPPGCRLVVTADAMRIERYWDPVPAGEPVNWITEDELDSFDDRFNTAVVRAVGGRRPGIFLSGGLDSISVAAVATDFARRAETAEPIALSLGFPDPSCNEELIQRGVAKSLGIEQEFVPFFDAAPARGLLTAALDCTRRSPAPMLNTWGPAYTELALRGKRRGVDVILSGSGGDEWLCVSPYLVADLIRTRDVRGLANLAVAWQRSYRMTPWQVLRGTMFTYGVRPLASLALHGIAPKAWESNRLARIRRTTRPWVGADPELRRQLDARLADGLKPVKPANGFYFQDVRASLDHTLTSMELEEIFEMGRELDVAFRHPFWDADVVDMLYRTPPSLLTRGGRAKGLVRETVARRFPSLGLDRQKKVAGTSFFQSILRAEIPKLWKASGGAPALVALGVIDAAKTNEMVQASLAEFSREGLNRVWNLLNLDAWVQSRTGGAHAT